MRRPFVCLAALTVSILGFGLPEATGGAATAGWTLMSGPPPISGSTLNWDSVSCVSSTFCMAVGPMKTPTPPMPVEPSELWNGSTWSYVSVPVPSVPAQLTHVSCVTSSFCMAVGNTGAAIFADEWNGSAWSSTSVAQPSAGDGVLFSVDCLSATDCEAVGQTVPYGTLAEQWDGTSWTIDPGDNPGTQVNLLAGVSCIDPSDCWAVGEENGLVLAERLDGSAWSAVSTPDLGGDSVSLDSISCASETFCEAVGVNYLEGSQAGSAPLIETWDGSTWTVASNPVPAEPGQNAILMGLTATAQTRASPRAMAKRRRSCSTTRAANGFPPRAPSPVRHEQRLSRRRVVCCELFLRCRGVQRQRPSLRGDPSEWTRSSQCDYLFAQYRSGVLPESIRADELQLLRWRRRTWHRELCGFEWIAEPRSTRHLDLRPTRVLGHRDELRRTELDVIGALLGGQPASRHDHLAILGAHLPDESERPYQLRM